MKRFSLILGLLLLPTLIGCGNGMVSFGGKVTFPDGTPYTKGYVCFTQGAVSARGAIQKDGTYSLGSFKDDDGLSPGKYRVYLAGFHEIDEISQGRFPVLKSDIDLKYERPETSGLECDVTKGGRFDIVVEPNQKQK